MRTPNPWTMPGGLLLCNVGRPNPRAGTFTTRCQARVACTRIALPAVGALGTFIALGPQAAAVQLSHWSGSVEAPIIRPVTTVENSGRRITLDDILQFARLTDVRISPNGKSVAYVMLRPGPNNVEGESSEIWIVDAGTKTSRRLVTAASPNPQPQWSSNGRYIAYLASNTASNDIWLVNVKSGRRRRVTRATRPPSAAVGGTIEGFSFSPTGDQIALVRAFSDTERQDALQRRKIIALSEHPYFLFPECITGWGRSAVIEVVSVRSRRTVQLTPPLVGATSLQWSPDGTRLLFVPLCHFRGMRPAEASPTMLTIATRKIQPLVVTPTVDFLTTWSPDGRAIAFLGYAIQGTVPYRLLLRTWSLGTGEPAVVADESMEMPCFCPIIWTRDGVIYAGSRSHATMRIVAFAPDGSKRRVVTPERIHVRTFSLSVNGRWMAAIFEDANTPGEVYVGDPVTGEFERLTDLGSALRGIALGAVEIVRWRSGDDRFDVEGFLVKPPNYSPGKGYPLLVAMHGGTFGLYQNAFVDINFSARHTPAQLYAAIGYLVFLPNRRGDDSYGIDFAAALVQHWGDDVKFDVLAGVDALIKRGIADSSRLGVMGHSYGGYATAWATAMTDRFRAASIHDGPVNLLSYYGQQYLSNDSWMDPYFGGNPSVALEQYLKGSPILYAHGIKTPTLLRYGGSRFPRSPGMPLQGMELFRALHERGIPVEFLYHPTQGHPINDEEVYRDYVRRNLLWFGYWVLGQGTNPLHNGEQRAGPLN